MNETFVLIPGAWHGSWCWRYVVPLLETAGNRACALTLPGLAERSSMRMSGVDLDRMIADVIDYIRSQDLNDVTLVGHSFGGMVVHGVADRLADRLRRLVYLDALWSRNGECVFDVMPGIREERIRQSQAFDGGFGMPPPEPGAFGVADEAQKAWLEEKLTPHPLQSYQSPIRLDAPPTNGLPTTYVACTAPVLGALARSHEAARAAGVSMVELAAPHDSMLTHPRQTAELIMVDPAQPRGLRG